MEKLEFLVLVLCAVTIQASTIPTRAKDKCFQSSHQCYDERIHPDSQGSTRVSKNLANELETNFWLNNAKDFVDQQIKRKINTNVAKNVIFFIGDGMSVPTISAARVYMGGEEQKLSFEKFPHTGLSKTYCLDRKVPDSASTATAYLTGVKANYGTIGVNGQVTRKDCNAAMDVTKHTTSIAKWAQDAGKATGIVTTTRITHASPAGNYANTADRDWENDAEVPAGCPKDIDIATQLIHGEVGSKFKVILGGGRAEFLNETVVDEEGNPGYRQDGKNLIQEWLDADSKRKYVFNSRGLSNIDAKTTDSLMGLFQDDHMLYHLEAEHKGLDTEKPTLEEMTRKAIEILQKSENGFYLFVEGGKIDLAHHDVYAKIALDETAELSKAVQAAVDMTNEDDTLIVVTSDHAHTMSYAGYPVSNPLKMKAYYRNSFF